MSAVLEPCLAVQSASPGASGLNRAALALPATIGTLLTLTLRSFYRYRPEGAGDQRQLLAVLSELKTG